MKPLQVDGKTVWRYWLESADRALLEQFAHYAHPNGGDRVFQDENHNPPLFRFQIDENRRVMLKQSAAGQGCNIIEEFDYLKDKTADRLLTANGSPVVLKEKSTREYQNRSAHKLFWDGKVHSGILVMPCGSGKTLTGITVCSIVRRSVLIFVTSVMAGHQWKKEFVRWTNIEASQVSVFTNDAKKKGGWNPHAKVVFPSELQVVISTYHMFSGMEKRAAESVRMIESVRKRVWGTMILDEVHLCPAQIFRTVATKFSSHVKLGLTATMVREDDLVSDVQYLVGPVIHELDTLDLRMRRYIAPVYCSEIVVPLSDQFQTAYGHASSAQERRLISVCNPNKARIVKVTSQLTLRSCWTSTSARVASASYFPRIFSAWNGFPRYFCFLKTRFSRATPTPS